MNDIILKKYRIKQNVSVGPKYTEHHYQAFNSNFVGRWQRYGGKVDLNESVQSIVCDYCSSDYSQRLRNRESFSIPPRSYQVQGYTYPIDKWDWEFCICKNRHSCWGQSERLFDVKRKQDKYQMTHIKVLGGKYEQIEDRQYVELTRKSNYPNRFQGIMNRSRRPSFFWPNLFDGQPWNDWYIFHVDNQTNLPLPDHVRGSPFCTLPEVYQKPEYMYVNNIKFEIFRRNRDYPFPTNLWECKQNHHPVAITTLDLYPGGAGFKCKQLKYLVNKEFDKSVKSSSDVTWTAYDLMHYPGIHKDWTEEEYIYPAEAFVPYKQDGYAGPITSYYHRINCNNPYFS